VTQLSSVNAVLVKSASVLRLPESEDIFQQAKVKAVPSESQVNDPQKISAWFYSFLRTTVIDQFRRQKKFHQKSGVYAREILPVLVSQTEEKLCNCLNHFMDDLSKNERELLNQHFVDGKTFKELSQNAGQTESAVRVRAMRARKKLKEAFRTFCNADTLSDTQACDC